MLSHGPLARRLEQGTHDPLVLNSLGLEKDMLLVAKDDELGRKLQDLKLVTRKRAPKDKRTNK